MVKKEERPVWWKSPKKIILTVLGIWLLSTIVLGTIESIRFSSADKIAIVPITGPIGVPSSFLTEQGVSSSEIIAQLESIEEDVTVKAVILEINSPGGSALSSKEIADKVDSLDIPTIAWIREVGASGAYWIAASSDYIVADELSITGSIGVIGSYLQFEELFQEYGIEYEQLIAGKYKDAGSPFRELTPVERNLLQQKLDLIHEIFIKDIAEYRNLSIEEVRKSATGMFYLGLEAKELGLIDILGGKKEAIGLAEEQGGITEYETVVYAPSRGFFGFLENLGAQAFYYMGKGIGTSLVDNVKIQAIPNIAT